MLERLDRLEAKLNAVLAAVQSIAGNVEWFAKRIETQESTRRTLADSARWMRGEK